MYNKLTAIGIDMPEPIINWDRYKIRAIPGTSGPAWVAGSPEMIVKHLKEARFVKDRNSYWLLIMQREYAPEPITSV